MSAPRVDYLPDSFHEVNGVEHTSRIFVAYAQRHNLPFLCIRAGTRALPFEHVTELRTLELRRSRASIRIEKDLDFDPLFFRHAASIRRELLRFRPDIIHITGPSEPRGSSAPSSHGSKRFLSLPSWHTNVHAVRRTPPPPTYSPLLAGHGRLCRAACRSRVPLCHLALLLARTRALRS